MEMYLHLGQNTLVPVKSVLGVFDLDNSTSSHITRKFLNNAEKNKKVINIAEDIPRSFVLCCENGDSVIYLSQLSSQTLLKRSQSSSLFGL